MQIFMSFYEGQLKQQMLYTAYFFNAFNVCFYTASNFPNFDDLNAFFCLKLEHCSPHKAECLPTKYDMVNDSTLCPTVYHG